MKKNILCFVLGIIVASGVVFAATTITADQIQYDENTTVKDKIDDLYRFKSVDSINKITDYGVRLQSRSKTLDLTAGNYIIFVVGNQTLTPLSPTYEPTQSFNTICNECELVEITSDYLTPIGTSTLKVPNGNTYVDAYVRTLNYTHIYKTSINTNARITTTINYSTSNNVMNQVVEIYAVKLK